MTDHEKLGKALVSWMDSMAHACCERALFGTSTAEPYVCFDLRHISSSIGGRCWAPSVPHGDPHRAQILSLLESELKLRDWLSVSESVWPGSHSAYLDAVVLRIPDVLG
jgi:hypothetical protein